MLFRSAAEINSSKNLEVAGAFYTELWNATKYMEDFKNYGVRETQAQKGTFLIYYLFLNPVYVIV